MTLTRTHLIAGAIVLVAAIVATTITLYLLYFVQPGRETHDAFVTDNTVLRLMVQPEMEQDYLSSLTPGFSKYVKSVPRFTSMQPRAFRIDAIHTLPYEMTLLLEAPMGNTYPATLFMNTLPESEGLLEELNRPGFFHRLGFVEWPSKSFAQQSDQVFIAKGDLISEGSAAAVNTAPELEQTHWFELAADNDSGVVAALHDALVRAEGAFIDESMHHTLFALWPSVAGLHVSVDLDAPDMLRAEVKVNCTTNADMTMATEALDTARAIVADWLDAAGTVAMRGGWTKSGARTIEGTFHISGWEKHLRRVLGT